MSSCNSSESAENLYGTSPGMLAPLISAQTIRGDSFTLEKLRGKKVIIDFWASWCGPCLRDAPAIVELYNSKDALGLEVVSIALEKKLDGRSEKLAAQLGFDWPYQIIEEVGFVRFNDVAKAYGVTDIPATFLLDEEGRILLENVSIQEITEYLSKNR